MLEKAVSGRQLFILVCVCVRACVCIMQQSSSVPVADSWEDDEVEFDLQAGAAIDSRTRQQQQQEQLEQARKAAAAKRSDPDFDPTLVAKLAERKHKEQEQLERQRILQAELDALPETARKLRLQKLTEEADLQYASEWLGGCTSSASATASATPVGSFSLDSTQPRTKADFERFAQALVDRLCTLRRGAKTPRSYILFLKDVLHGLFVTSDVLSLAEVCELADYVHETLKSERELRERSGVASGAGGGAGSAAAGASTASHTAHSRGARKASIRVERGDDFEAFAVRGSRHGASAIAERLPDDEEDFM